MIFARMGKYYMRLDWQSFTVTLFPLPEGVTVTDWTCTCSGNNLYAQLQGLCNQSKDKNRAFSVYWIGPQASVENLKARGASSTITDLNSTATRALTGAQIARSISDMFTSKNVTEWESHIEAIDKPDYYISFAAIVSSTLTLAYPDAIVDRVVTLLFNLFSVDQEVRDFITKEYLTEVSYGKMNWTML